MNPERISCSAFLPMATAFAFVLCCGSALAQSAPAAPSAPAVAAAAAVAPSADAAPPAPTSPVPPETAQAEAPTPPGGTITPPGSSSPRNWTTDQILTATVHQAWILAGKDETNFFEIVRELAEISAQNRNLTLRDDPEMGKKAGAYIRAQAKEDHDQLLYDIVDKAVRMTGTRNAAAETSGTTPQHP